jgi:hypothetical protein
MMIGPFGSFMYVDKMEGLDFILLRKRKTHFGDNKHSPGSACKPRINTPKKDRGKNKALLTAVAQ